MKPADKRSWAQHLAGKFPRAQRNACRGGLLDLHRATCRYKPKLRDDAAPRQRIRDIAQARPRFGSRRIYVMLGPKLP